MALKQRYTGDVTILPKLGGPSCLLRLVTNPTKSMMETYIFEGRAAAELAKLDIGDPQQVLQDRGAAALRRDRDRGTPLGVRRGPGRGRPHPGSGEAVRLQPLEFRPVKLHGVPRS